MEKVEVDAAYLQHLETIAALYIQEKRDLIRRLEFSASQSNAVQSITDNINKLNGLNARNCILDEGYAGCL